MVQLRINLHIGMVVISAPTIDGMPKLARAPRINPHGSDRYCGKIENISLFGKLGNGVCTWLCKVKQSFSKDNR